MGDHMMT